MLGTCILKGDTVSVILLWQRGAEGLSPSCSLHMQTTCSCVCRHSAYQHICGGVKCAFDAATSPAHACKWTSALFCAALHRCWLAVLLLFVLVAKSTSWQRNQGHPQISPILKGDTALAKRGRRFESIPFFAHADHLQLRLQPLSASAHLLGGKLRL